jgi:hypothetical protein
MVLPMTVTHVTFGLAVAPPWAVAAPRRSCMNSAEPHVMPAFDYQIVPLDETLSSSRSSQIYPMGSTSAPLVRP